MLGRSAGISAGDLLRLALWKGRQRMRHVVDHELHGEVRMHRRAADWARAWRRTYQSEVTPLAAWRRHPDAGRLWLSEAPMQWAERTCTSSDIDLADSAVRGNFDLLGSGRVALGQRPTWRRDLYSGYVWPLERLTNRDIYRSDGSDIRTVWELSRCRHFLALARAYAKTEDTAYRAAFVTHVESFIADNPLSLGPHWLSPMDAGIRAANWILAAEIFAQDEAIPGDFWESLLSNLYVTGRFVERHLEWHPVYRGNHYVANGIALLYLGVFFKATDFGERFFARGRRILTQEIEYQVGEDGVSFEGSLAYHRLVTEFFAWGAELLRHNAAETSAYVDRLHRMYAFIESYLPTSGLAPMLGDADDGRLHAVSAEGEGEPRRHRLGIPDHYWPRTAIGSNAFRQGGFFVMRDADDHVVIRCGPVGLRGAGSHDHNDQLSIEMCLGGRRVVADSGTFTYSRDLRERYAFRSSAAHNGVQLGDEEQNPIAVDRPWRILQDRTRAECVRWETTPERRVFEGVHRGYSHRASRALCRRRIEFSSVTREWRIVDDVEGQGVETVTWRLHLAPGTVDIERLGRTAWQVRLAGQPTIRIQVTLPESFELALVSTAISDGYGRRTERPSLLARGGSSLPLRFATTFTRATQ